MSLLNPVRRALHRARRSAFSASASLGIHSLWRNSSWRSQRLAILCYHALAVDDEAQWDPSFFMPANLFAQRLQQLHDEDYRVLPLGEALRRLQDGSLPPRAAAITFDDGTADFHHLAAPLLERFSFPATVYVTTFHVLSQTPAFKMFTGYLLWKGRQSYTGGPLGPLGAGFDLHSPAVLAELAARLHEHVRQHHLPEAGRLALLQQLGAQLNVDFDAIYRRRILRLLTPDETRNLAGRGFDIQLHTHRHRTPRDQALFTREIEDNRRILTELGGLQLEHFCYPSGVYADDFLPWLQELGVHSATTCEFGLASQASHPLLLPRLVDTTPQTAADFSARLAGLLPSREQRRYRSAVS